MTISAALDRTSDVYLRASRFIVLAVTIGMFAVMVAANSLEIAGRSLFATSFSWVQEVSILAAMWVYFFGYALIAKDDEYIRVDIISRFVPEPVNRGLDLFARCAVVAFHMVVLWFGVETFRFLNLFTTNVLDWPESLFVLPIVLGSADILLTEAIRLRRLLSGASPPAAVHRSLDAE